MYDMIVEDGNFLKFLNHLADITPGDDEIIKIKSKVWILLLNFLKS